MNTIIALRGRGNSGKTTTIRLLYNYLFQNNYQLIKSNFNITYGDFSALFSKKEKLIGVTSFGDSYDLVHDHLEELVNEKCNICVCACRTFDRIPPGTNTAIIEFTNYLSQFVEKTIDENGATQTATNMSDVQKIFSMIDNMI